MRKYIFISIGCFLGAIARYYAKSIYIGGYNENIPLNTLVINVLGSLILALILTVAFEIWDFDADIRIGITTGFLGAFTTFSSLCKETVGLLNSGDYFSAISYMTISTVLGLGAAYFGIVVAREVISKLMKGKAKKEDLPINEIETETERDVE